MQVPITPAFTAGVLAGRREAFEHVAAAIRRKIAAWRAEEAKRGKVLGALLWSVTERWIARAEALAAELDQQAAGVRMQEAAEAVTPAPAAAPSKPRKKRAR